MRQLLFCLLALSMLTPTQGEGEAQLQLPMDSVGIVGERDSLECFRCDLGFWDTCYTTKINCTPDEWCYTGRGKAADVLDVKTLGCAKPEECSVETLVELLPNQTIFVMTKHCCDTPFCNSARGALPTYPLLYLTVAFLITWNVPVASVG